MSSPSSAAPRRFFRAAIGPAGAGALAALLFLSLLLKDPLLCWRDDYMLSILPAFADIARAWNEGTWPLLSPYSWGCGNLAGEYQYGTFSVFVNALVVVVWKFHPSYPAAAAALSAAHIFALAAGAYLLGKKRGLAAPHATLVALVGALNGWNVCWGATDWFGAIAALAWLPWAWWALEVALDAPRPDWRWLLPAPFIYLLLTGGFPYTVVMLAAVTAWLALRGWVGERRFGVVWPLGIGWILGLGLSAPAWLSLLQYMHGSGRSEGEDIHHFAWVAPWRALPGLVLPSWRVDWPNFLGDPRPHTAIELTGALVPLAALLVLVFTQRRALAARQTLRWDIGLALAALGLCLLPSAGVFRWSFRWLPFFQLAFALAGAQALQLLEPAAGDETSLEVRRQQRRQIAVWTFWLVFGVNLVEGIFQLNSPGRWASSHQAYTMLAVGVWIGLVNWPRVLPGFARWLPTAAAAATMAISYTALTLNPEVPRYPFTGNLANAAPLSRERLYLSLYRAPYHHYFGGLVPQGFGAVLRMGNTGMFSGVQIINGYSPIHPAGVGRYFSLETHGQPDPQRALQALQDDAAMPDGPLARLGVDGLLIARDFPLPAGLPSDAQWERAFESAEGMIYHRKGSPFASVRAWESRAPGGPAEFAPAAVRIVRDARQEVLVKVTADPARREPILLAFRRPFFSGYRATFNGRPVPVGAYREMFPAVELPPGASGELRLVYRPAPVRAGAAAALASGLFILACAGWFWRRRPRTPGEIIPS